MNKIYVKHTNDNITPVICKLLNTLSDECENIIEFEKGTYYFHKEGSDSYPIYASSGRKCDGRKGNVLFPLIGQKNVTIDGNGSEFVICDRLQPFMVQNSNNVIFRNFSLDYSFLRYGYADVVSVSDEGVSLFINKALCDYYIDSGNICFVCGKESVSTKTCKISFKPIFPPKDGICFLYVGDFEGEYNGAALNVSVNAEQDGDNVFLRYREGSPKIDFEIEPGDRVCMAYDNDREYQMFWLDCSKNIFFENVTIYRNGGMGIVCDVCENILIDGLHVGLKQGRDEYYSSTADAIFVTNCSGDFILRNSSIFDTYDDAINIHGYYLVVDEVLGDKKIKLITIHPAHTGIANVDTGDELRFNDPESANELFSAKILECFIDKSRKYMYVTLDDASLVKKGLIVENKSKTPKVTIENNKITNCPHMRLSAPEMTIRNNKLSLQGEDIYISDLWGFWSEYGAVKNVKIYGNTFAGGKKFKNIKIESCRTQGHNRNHDSITIKDNVFERDYEACVHFDCVENLIFENNKFGEKVK